MIRRECSAGAPTGMSMPRSTASPSPSSAAQAGKTRWMEEDPVETPRK